jgi:UDP-N-acetylmuramate dehydrogenase
MKIFSHHPLKTYNTFGIEVFAQEFSEAGTDEELKQLISYVRTKSRPMIILGGGSNTLFTGDISGMVIKVNTYGKEILKEDDEEIQLRVASGEDWDSLVEYCVDRGWGGLENLSGIPGQVGSGPIQNIGAYGAELKDHFESLEAINLCTGETIHYDKDRCQFGYRDSIFKRALKGRIVITQVVFRLRKKPLLNLTYQALKQKLEHLPEQEVTIRKVREAVLQIRSSKLPDPKVIGNAGSFFKNPVIGYTLFKQLKERFPGIVYNEVPLVQSSSVPDSSFRIPDHQIITDDYRLPAAGYKLAAGWLIEQCGWKGYREGDAGVHKDQALVIVNYGKATGREILDLAGKIQLSVKEKFGIDLEREVNVV